MELSKSNMLIVGDPDKEGRWLAIPALCVLITTSYLLLNWQFTGPTYLGDEIGYLSNAAFLAGSQIDGSSSYHFGYSLFLVPNFLLFADTAVLWKSVLVTNAVIFSAVFSVLYLIGEYLCTNRWYRLGAVLLAAAYPAYPTMSGYAFSQPAFVLVFILCCYTLLRSSRLSYFGQGLFGILVGFLFWIHPTGLPVAVAAGIVCIAAIAADRHALKPALVSIVLIVLMIFTYKLILHPGLMEAMTPAGFSPRSHYPDIASRLLRFLDARLAYESLTRILGQLSYLVISTFSVFTVGIIFIFGEILKFESRNGNTPFYLFILLSLLGLFATVSLFFGGNFGPALNSWFYGRYAEGLILPILFISLLHRVGRRANLVVSLSVIVVFVGLFLISGFPGTWVNMVNVSAFWPAVLPVKESFLVWFSIGAAGCVIGILVPRAVQLLLLVVSFGFCIAAQVEWHKGSFRITSTPSGLLPAIRDSLPPGSCIGIGSVPEGPRFYQLAERYNLYSYYLNDYRYQRMTPTDWWNTCDGYYLTFQEGGELAALGALQVGMEAKTGLRVFSKKTPVIKGNTSNDPYFLRPQTSGGSDGFTFNVSAEQISTFSGVGQIDDGALKTTGRSGFLFFGPYIEVHPGVMTFKLYGVANDVDGAWIDVTSNWGGTIHGEFPIRTTQGESGVLAEGEIVFPDAVREMEVRLRVREGSDIQFHRYTLNLPN